MRTPPRDKFIKGFVGCAAVILWFVLFGAGLLIDSKEYRERIVTHPAVATAGVAAEGAARTEFHWRAFAASLVLYTPLNAAFLTLLAGFIGGCASNLTYGGPGTPTGGNAEDSENAVRMRFLTESPFASTLRSFLVYLALLAGIYITGNSPFEQATASQYARFAGTVSFLAFVVGYDPTKFQAFMSMSPRAGSKNP
jgi:hypothetical protein